MYLFLLLLCLLCFCGPVGWAILFILFLIFLFVTESWGVLLFLAILMILGWTLRWLIDGKKVSHKTIKSDVNPKTLENNNETISVLVKIVGRMPDDGTPISQTNVPGMTTAEWNLYLDWFRKNADEYVDISNYTIRVKSKFDKKKLLSKLFRMKTDEAV